ncbi:MAG TPA: 2'-deoxycytidine 5'-triphosphate deaminase [Solirubrobacteraceae bacterium]|nr:2'-deoxycytidine 5'-triphosphate deaminase [Solirubrobacteraceae bacterium]
MTTPATGRRPPAAAAASARASGTAPGNERPTGGVLPAQRLRDAIANGWIDAGEWRIPPESVQPASVDLRLGDRAWVLRCSFLPDSESTVEQKVADLAFEQIDLRDGATLERDRPYLVPLIEQLRLPDGVRAKANPKSSTGRLDVFTRVLTDRSHRFDEIAAGYSGQLYLEVVPRTFAIRVKTGLALNQVRLIDGDGRLSDAELLRLHGDVPLLFRDNRPLAPSSLSLGEGLFLGLDASGGPDSTVGYRAKKNSLPIDLTKVGALRWQDYWEPVQPEAKQRIVLEPEVFYLLLSAEGVSIPPSYAAEMLAYDPTAGELRTHYAGFFDPGFGFSRSGALGGSRAALEVRARDVSFMVEHGQPVCKLAFERMAEEPDVLYGEDVKSNYQGQQTMLSKHFLAHAADPPA